MSFCSFKKGFYKLTFSGQSLQIANLDGTPKLSADGKLGTRINYGGFQYPPFNHEIDKSIKDGESTDKKIEVSLRRGSRNIRKKYIADSFRLLQIKF